MMNCEENTENSESSDEDYVPDSRIEDAASEVESDGDADEDFLSADSEDDEKKLKIKNKKKRSKQTKRSRKKTKIAPNKKEITGQELKSDNDIKSTTEDQKKKADDLWADFMKDTGFKSKNSSSNNKSTIQTNNTSSNNNINKSSTPSTSSSSSSSSASSSTNNIPASSATVKITQIFEFAGEEVKVEKEVDKNSAEARLLLLTQSPKATPKKSSGTGGSLTGIGSILSQLGKKQKISTLEKTKLDWDRFKKDENLEEELEIHNKGKDGYLDKQDFLQRADLRRFEIEKEIRNVERAKRFK